MRSRHRSTNRIDDAVSDKLQNCLNFNDAIKTLFGSQPDSGDDLPIALIS